MDVNGTQQLLLFSNIYPSRVFIAFIYPQQSLNLILDKINLGTEKVDEFLESQKQISQLKSVMNEKEVRLTEVEGKSTKKSK